MATGTRLGRKSRGVWRAIASVGAVLGASTIAAAQGSSVGPDVQYTDCTSTSNYGAVNGIRGYALGSNTCNIGNVNLQWISHGTPALAMNAYRLVDGRLLQIGQGWCKTACCAGSGPGCGFSCVTGGGGGLGAGCMDVYSSGFNGGQTALGPRSVMNAYTGAIGGFPSTSGDAIYRRLQIPQSDLTAANFPGALYFIEGEYMSTDDATAHNGLNNASYKRVTFDQSTFNMTLIAPMNVGKPAINAWHDHGLGIGTPDPSVSIKTADVAGEGRFFTACKVTPLGNGKWRYDYAVFNLNSDRSGGSFQVPLPANVVATNVGFHGVPYHSGEPYDNTNWTISTAGGAVTWSSPQAYAVNANSNALRWGTMYNFWFDANARPGVANATLGLFKPGTPTSVLIGTSAPGVACRADWDQDGSVIPSDVAAYINTWSTGVAGGSLDADMDGNGTVQAVDVSIYVNQWFAAIGGSC